MLVVIFVFNVTSAEYIQLKIVNIFFFPFVFIHLPSLCSKCQSCRYIQQPRKPRNRVWQLGRGQRLFRKGHADLGRWRRPYCFPFGVDISLRGQDAYAPRQVRRGREEHEPFRIYIRPDRGSRAPNGPVITHPMLDAHF